METPMSLFAPARKEQLHARVALDGPTGSGKTWTALQWARILAGPDGPIGVIDTENRSAAYYAPPPGDTPTRVHWWEPPYVFGHMPWTPPYDPAKLARTVEAAATELGPTGVLVIDSLTHFWFGEGGTLDIVEKAAAKSHGNKFAGWKSGTPIQRNMLDTIIHAPCHVIVTMRSKMEYVLQTNEKTGKQEPVKVGMAPEQRAGVEYEFTVVADKDLEHRLFVSKSRCDQIADAVAEPGRAHEPAQRFAAWLSSGVERVDDATAQEWTKAMNDIRDDADRQSIKAAFVARFGRPNEVTVDRVADVVGWLADNVVEPPPPPVSVSGSDYDQGTVVRRLDVDQPAIDSQWDEEAERHD
jgi:hypothetical protein